jgi:Carboxypeptidase regulatory-like domain
MTRFAVINGFSLFVAVVVLGAAAFGQTAEITGVITDPNGAAIVDAAVTARNADTGINNEAVTNSQGYYTFPHLNPGNYEIAVRKSGFRTTTRPAIKLDVAQVARIDLSLTIGEVKESITVEAEAPILSSQIATVEQVIGSEKIVNLPLNGRDFTQLATLVPGAISRGTNSSMQAPAMSINGSRTSKTVFMIDGGSVSSQYFDVASIVPSVDAIQEFSVQSNSFAAEYGQGTSIVNVSLRSGTNQLHGTAFEFLRNQDLDARNFFNTTGVRPAVKQNQFGFTLGGPIVIPHVYNGKNRTFIFGDYEGTRVRRAQTFNNLVPTAGQRDGDFSAIRTPIYNPLATQPDPNNPGQFIKTPFPGNVIPANLLSSQAAFYLPFYPLPNTAQGTFNFVPNSQNTVDKFDIRVDHHFSDADALSGSYSFNQVLNYTPGQFAANGGVTQEVRRQRAGLSETHSFGPATLNELRLNYVRTRESNAPQGLGTNYTVNSGIGGFVDQSGAFPGFPGLTISGYLGFNGNAFSPIIFRDNKYEIGDNVTWVRGSHAFKAGALLRYYDTATVNAARSRGAFTFNGTFSGNSFADFLLGLPYQGQRTFPRNEFGIAPMRNEHVFIQDDWKVTRTLTLNLGLRYELNNPPTVLHNQMASTDPVLQRIVVASDSGGNINYNGQQVGPFLYPLFAQYIVPSSKAGLGPSLRYLDTNNFAPRLGVAWRVANDFVVRMGYGIFYGLIEGNRSESTGIVNPPFLADELSNFNTQPIPTKTLANMFAPVQQGLNLVPLNFFQIEPHMADPYVQQWNVTLQKVVKGNLSLEAGWVGSKGTKIEFSRPVNVPAPGPGAIQNRRLWPLFASGTYVEDSGYSTYNSLQVKAEIRNWRGLSFLSSYAFAKSIDNLSSDVQGFSSQDPNNNNGEKGVSDYDVKQRWVTSLNYALPFARKRSDILGRIVRDWAVGSIFTAQSGLPFTPGISTDPANTGTSLRPNRVASGTVANPGVNLWFNPAAFTVPAAYTYGNSGRNILYGPGFFNWDAVVTRIFPITERMKLQFRGEFFNFTNTPAFAQPITGIVTNIQAGNAGHILTAGEPRDVQVALKLLF